MTNHERKPRKPINFEEHRQRRQKAKEQRPAVSHYQLQKLAGLSYDYGQLPEQHREQVQRAALDIRARLKRTVEDMIEIGRQLNEVKGLLPEGQFERWMATEFEMSRRSAFEFRSMADRFAARSAIIALLSPTIVRRLAAVSIPDEAVEAVIAEAQAQGKPLRVRDAMAIVKPFLPAKERRPKQLTRQELIYDAPSGQWINLASVAGLTGPRPEGTQEPDEPGVIEAEYTIVQQDTDMIILTLTRSLVRKFQAGALRNQRFWDMFSPEELDRLNIIFSTALKWEME